MRITIERRRSPTVASHLVEIVTPRVNAAGIRAVENLLAGLGRAEPFSLEIAATNALTWFLVRAENPRRRESLEAALGAAYPQAGFRGLDLERYPYLDPARLGPDEQVVAGSLGLREPPCLPLRTFGSDDLADPRERQADPILGILESLRGLPPGWRGLSQLVLRPAPADWARDYLRLALENPLAHPSTVGSADTSLTSVFALAGLLLLAAVGLRADELYTASDWWGLAQLLGASGLGVGGLVRLRALLTPRPPVDPRLVREKLSHRAFLAEVRLAIFAPRDVPASHLAARLERLADAYDQFDLVASNGFQFQPLSLKGRDLTRLSPLLPRSASLLTARELAGLWHLPHASADVPRLERTTARHLFPIPSTVARGCPIGISSSQGQDVPVSIPDEILRRHLLLVAKTRRGKSSLLFRLARHLAESAPAGTPRPATVLVDPHRDLARAALGVVPAERRKDVVFLDVAELARPFGLNLLDVGLGWTRDQAVASTLTIFRREFDRFWGPRMEDAFRFALLTLFEVNQAICAADPNGAARQHTTLDVPALLADPDFRRGLLPLVHDRHILDWWSRYFDTLDRRLQLEIINPVQTKVQRYVGSEAARLVVGQPRSTVDPSRWIRDGAIVVISTAKDAVGEDTAGLVGATLLNLIALAIADQARLAPADRRPVSLIVDEFHTLAGADYETIPSELSKFGASLVLATQSLARLEALDHAHQRALRAMVFANLDGLFAFHCSAEDARYLIPELGSELDEEDLVALGEHRCYVRLSARGERLRTFSVHLDPPPATDPTVALALALASATRYGHRREDVERDLLSALARRDEARTRDWEGAGTLRDASTPPGYLQDQERKRNEHRPQRRRRNQPHQATLFPRTSDEAGLPPPDAADALGDDVSVDEGEEESE